MITEDYASYEVAKLLKEKGFDGLCYCHEFTDYEGNFTTYHTEYPENWNQSEPCVSIPTLGMAMKWLREEKDIYICVIPRTNYNMLTHESSIWYYTNCERKENWGEGTTLMREKEFYCPTWEEACESVLKYALENLI